MNKIFSYHLQLVFTSSTRLDVVVSNSENASSTLRKARRERKSVKLCRWANYLLAFATPFSVLLFCSFAFDLSREWRLQLLWSKRVDKHSVNQDSGQDNNGQMVSMASGRVYSVSIASVYLLGKYNIVYMPYSTSYSFITNYILCFSKRVIFARFLCDVPFITRNIFRRIIGEAIKVRSIVLFHSASRQNWITLGSRSEWVLFKKQNLASSTPLWNIIRIKRMPSSDFLATGCGFRLSTPLVSHFREIKYIGSFGYTSTISSTFVSRLFFFQHLPANVDIVNI